MSDNELLEKAITLFREKFKSEPEVAAFAPGRANFIGEHTDYNDGFVLPFALPYKTIFVAGKSSTRNSTVISSAKPDQPVVFQIDANLTKGSPDWANYVKGVIAQYLKELIPLRAAINGIIVSTVPIGSGLSSSAALEVATATMLEEMYQIKLDGVNKALRCQKAEHTFAGVPCGIMDQFISAMGQDGALLKLDCRDKSFTLVPFGSGDSAPLILVTNSNVKHELTGSEYPDRVRQCTEAVDVLRKTFPEVKALRDATLEMLNQVKDQMHDVAFRRARHVIGENRRTEDTAIALQRNDFKTAGELMVLSHNSLRDDYEVSCPELDFLVRIAMQVPGVYGSRMTGGGFGGCTVTLVDRSAVSALEKHLTDNYFKQYHQRCDCYEASPSKGAGLLNLAKFRRDVPGQWTWSVLVPATAAVVAAAVIVAFTLAKSKR